MNSGIQPRPRHARLPSNLDTQRPTYLDGGVAGNQFSRPLTRQQSEVGDEGRVKRLPHGTRHSNRRESRPGILTPIIAFFKRKPSRNTEQIAEIDVHPEIAQLRQEVSALRKRFADLEDANRPVYGLCQPSSPDVSRGLPGNKLNADSSSEYSDCKPPAIDVLAPQTNVTPLEMVGQTALTHQEQVIQVEIKAEGRSSAKDADPTPQPHIPLRDALSSPALDQNQGGKVLIPSTMALVRAGREEGLPETDKMSSNQPSPAHMGGEKLPRKNSVVGPNVEVEALAGHTAQGRLPRKKQRNESSEVEDRTVYVHGERLPRKSQGQQSVVT